jgi:hypothetical protein
VPTPSRSAGNPPAVSPPPPGLPDCPSYKGASLVGAEAPVAAGRPYRPGQHFGQGIVEQRASTGDGAQVAVPLTVVTAAAHWRGCPQPSIPPLPVQG